VQLAHQGMLWRCRNQAKLVLIADGAGQEGYPQGENAAHVTHKVVLPVVPPVGKQEKGNCAIKPYEDIPHIGVIIGADGPVHLFAPSELE